MTEAELADLCRERIGKKCLLMTTSSVSVDISEEEIQVMVSAHRKRFSLSVVKRAAVTEPEKKIRDAEKMKKGIGTVINEIGGIMDGTSDHD